MKLPRIKRCKETGKWGINRLYGRAFFLMGDLYNLYHEERELAQKFCDKLNGGDYEK
ncbi:hypothetical protein N9878_00815 [bacterium]|nr:hypothetical protein [bacterium]